MVMYENYNTGDDSYININGTALASQSFTVGNVGTNEFFTLTSVSVLVYRAGTPGTVTLSLHAVDADGKPTGAALSTGTFNGNLLTNISPGEWKSVNMSAFILTSNTQYHLKLTSGNAVLWRVDISSPTYSGGLFSYSANSGASWTNYATQDLMFEIYGTPSPATNIRLNIADAWSDVRGVQVNIGDVWKTVSKIEINIGDVWKTIYPV